MEQSTSDNSNSYLFGKGQAIFILVIIAILNMINMMDRSVFAVAQEPMRIALGLNDTEVGWFQTVFYLGLSLMTLPVAFICDRWSRRKMLGILAISFSAFTFLTGLGRSFLGVLMPRMFVGVGESGFTSGGQALIVRAWPEKLRGTILAAFLFVSMLGQPLGMALGGMLIVKFNSWSSPFFFFAVPGILFGIIAFFLRDYENAPAPPKADGVTRESFFASIWTLFKTPTLLCSYTGYVTYNIVLAALAWIPTFLIRSEGINAGQAGMLVGIIGFIGLTGAILGGIISDWWQKRNRKARMHVCAISTMVGTFALIGALLLDVQGIGYALACVWAFGWLMLQAPNAAVTQDCSTLDKRGQAWGVNNFLGIITAWTGLAVGALSDSLGSGAYGLKIALICAAAFGLITFTAYFIGANYYQADVARANEANRLRGYRE
jgi:MFS family permease